MRNRRVPAYVGCNFVNCPFSSKSMITVSDQSSEFDSRRYIVRRTSEPTFDVPPSFNAGHYDYLMLQSEESSSFHSSEVPIYPQPPKTLFLLKYCQRGWARDNGVFVISVRASGFCCHGKNRIEVGSERCSGNSSELDRGILDSLWTDLPTCLYLRSHFQNNSFQRSGICAGRENMSELHGLRRRNL